MNKRRSALISQSKERFGDIFKQLMIREKIVRLKNDLLEEDHLLINRMVLQKARDELKHCIHCEVEF